MDEQVLMLIVKEEGKWRGLMKADSVIKLLPFAFENSEWAIVSAEEPYEGYYYPFVSGFGKDLYRRECIETK